MFIVTVERKNILNQNNTGPLKIRNYTFERVENFKYLGVILNEDNNHQTHLQERMKNANKKYFMLQNFFKNKNICFWLSCLCLFSLVNFFKEEASYLLLTRICRILSLSFCLLSGVSLYVFILLQ